MVKIREAILVEGRYDRNTLSQVVDAPIFQTNGFGIMNDSAQLALLRRVAAQRGLIVFTDSDGAGFVIRNYLKGAIPGEHLKHAYIPDVPGKERRKTAPGKEGKLGVEGMTPEVIIQCLQRAGATIDNSTVSKQTNAITKTDLYFMGLSGAVDSKAKRTALLRRLALPERMSTNAMLEAVNVLYTREELQKILDTL